ncbi:MAG TPA: UDP-3-O-(3-hydroxymyristoyl)glucosamine N-acyltransferase [Candidatus Methanoperedens sp.]|nr:UDP-3-O-(3-hydroxymyristoyl)glucosamine N-acyltransferase [Candidatus Methanoperedens sp.]
MTPTGPDRPAAVRFTLVELAARLGGIAEGDPGAVLTGVAGLAEAGPGELSFVEGERLLPAAAGGSAGALLAPPGLALTGRNVVRVEKPRLAFAAALALFHPQARPPAGVHPTAVVAPGAAIDPSATVEALCFVGAGARIGARAVLRAQVHVGSGATVGEDALLHPGARVLERVVLGARVIVHAGAVIGSDGFSYVFDGRGHRKIPQVGTVEVGDDVEIGAGATIDRATVGVTRIGRGTKIDNLVQVGHNVTIGEHAILVAQVGIGGSSRIGAGAVLAGQAGVADHAEIGAGARVAAQAGVLKHVAPGATVAGFGPQPHGEFLRSQAVFDQLPQLRRRVAQLEKRLAAAQAAAGGATPERR